MKTAIIAGASGLTGTHLVKLMLQSSTYNTVKILVRKPMDIEHSSLQQIVYDYEYPAPEVIKADDVYCCLGTTIKKAGSREAFKKVDYEYPLQVARIAHQNGAQKFSVISAIGANPKSKIFYNIVKGQVEEAIKEIPFEAIYILRPSMLLGNRKEFRFGEETAKIIMRPLNFLLPKNIKPIHASQVAACVLDKMNSNEKGFQVVFSGQMQKYPVISKELY